MLYQLCNFLGLFCLLRSKFWESGENLSTFFIFLKLQKIILELPLQVLSYFEKKTATTEFTESHESYPLPLVTICFDPFFKDVKSEKYQNFDSKSWAFSWIDGFQKDFNDSDMLGLWEESNHKFEQIVKEIIVIKNEGKDTCSHVVEPTKVRSF